MFRLWGKIMKSGHLVKDLTVTSMADTRTHRVTAALADICYQWNLAVPVWLEVNIREFSRGKKTRFTRDSFVETIDFDYLEIQILEE